MRLALRIGCLAAFRAAFPAAFPAASRPALHTAFVAALTLTLFGLPGASVDAQESALVEPDRTAGTSLAGSASEMVAVATMAGSTSHAVAPVHRDGSADADADANTNTAQLARTALSPSADDTAADDPAFEFTLDDQMLSRQRGGAVGMVMVAATPQLLRTNGGNNNVTLWDEIAPPSPLPVPVDAARTTQGNVASYQRK